ncbi:hypothetical protein ACTL32_01235 [Planococcus sp. FY231025]|uniref:hypothetical protein n=1 Tax=Planococcus sp. FY231025 TaxID=3455699 RepID=UPI003F9236CB
MKQFKRAAAAFFICLGLAASAFPVNSLAHNNGDGSPPHSVRGVSCEFLTGYGQTGVKAFPPNHVTAWWGLKDDVVRWTPVLYRQQGDQFIKWQAPQIAPAYAYVHSNGFYQGINPGWRSSTGHGQYLFFAFPGLPSGTYTVLNIIQWDSNGHLHMTWAPNSCAI